jgi:hypothetical protein
MTTTKLTAGTAFDRRASDRMSDDAAGSRQRRPRIRPTVILKSVGYPLLILFLAWAAVTAKDNYIRAIADPVVRTQRFVAESAQAGRRADAIDRRIDTLIVLRRVDSIINAGNHREVLERLDRIGRDRP